MLYRPSAPGLTKPSSTIATLRVTGGVVDSINIGAAPGTGALINIDVAALTYGVKFYNGSTHVGYIASASQTALEIGGGASMPLHFAANNLGKWDVDADASGTSTFSSENKIAIVRVLGSDGSDTGVLHLTGGGVSNPTRGAVVSIHGNEHASAAGDLLLMAGNVAGGEVRIYTGNSVERLTVGDDGLFTVRYGLQLANQAPGTLANGQIWYDGTNLKARLSGATVTIQVA